MQLRIGQGYDIHRLVEGRPLVIGGLTLEYDRGPLGHSDGDALLHAVTDAILGACALGDIGRHFPPSDKRFKDADSKVLLRQAIEMVLEAGFTVINIDSTVILEKPRLAPHIEGMRRNLAELLDLDLDSISVKAKTNEGLGPVGEGQAIAAQAVALVEKKK
ncbi:MAG: 2-C-methyl-D-erythritol 2,4-cyclodiphosphate synthase [Candidatus Obscuribacter sp.]|nr:2-C-methyl-D-erythritol 2,4-cyclodiphosphate synthase [Candidatus Obscuribacter sp.]MBK9279470.1 2-C-methyl-D-erythritol 2,4-cyclodiphosphate synthase [Candidatus Obscuribacter sp.]MBL8081453.1 2-C-methyl-D-erythritol 2,4-cyclodiphosphate synthase [Candidatus Obscuribacter sp.]